MWEHEDDMRIAEKTTPPTMNSEEYRAWIRKHADIGFGKFAPDEVEKFGEEVFKLIEFHFENYVPQAASRRGKGIPPERSGTASSTK
jgi:hypothetical protein